MGETTLPARREETTRAIEARQTARGTEAINPMMMGYGGGIDADDGAYRRLTTGVKFQTRDLSPLSFDRQLEVAWFLFEQNPFAHRIITLMTDLIIGEGITVEVKADDHRIQAAVDTFMTRNQIAQRLREYYMANALNGELVFPVGINPYSGNPVLGYIDSSQVKTVRPTPDNVLVLDELVLKGTTDQTLKIIRENPATGLLEGQAFFHRINALPNSLRGRSDLGPLADWLDLYDQFMFTAVERANLINQFAWDYKIEGATPDIIQQKLKAMPRVKTGQVFAHNEKETLEPRTPDLKSHDQTEIARLLRVHIAGTMGFPISHFGDIDSNRATIEGQNDVMTKTPAARQREFGALLDQMIRFTIEQNLGKNPALFRDAKPVYRIVMPEIAAKDIARAGSVLASVASAMDTSINNRTMSRKVAMRSMAMLVKQLGVEVDVDEMADEIEADDEERQALADLVQASLARSGTNQPNQPVPEDPTD